MTIVPAFGMLLEMFLCGSIKLSLMKTSSLIQTSSATTLTPSMRTHYPTIDCQPTMLILTKACALIRVLLMTTVSASLTPLAIVQLAPMTTFGPITLEESTLAVGSISTLPMMLSPLASSMLPWSFKCYKQYFVPVRKSLGQPRSIQYPLRVQKQSCPSSASLGKMSLSRK